MRSIHLDGKLSTRLDFTSARKEALLAIAQGEKILWELDLGPFSQHLFATSSRLLAIDHFLTALWSEFKPYTAALSLYRGPTHFDPHPFSEELKRLATPIPDALPLLLHFEQPTLAPLELARRTCRSLFPRFEIRIDNQPLPHRSWEAKVGFLLPSNGDLLFEKLVDQGVEIRIIDEAYLTAEWDGLDTLYIDPTCLSREGKRKVQGFQAAGGEVRSV